MVNRENWGGGGGGVWKRQRILKFLMNERGNRESLYRGEFQRFKICKTVDCSWR